MSSAINHKKRSHRSEYRAAPYHQGKRYSVGTPTLKKRQHFGIVDMIRRFTSARRMAKNSAAKLDPAEGV